MKLAAVHRTKTEVAVGVLREQIRTGELQAGKRLRVNGLTRELGMSPTPIREALRILQADGLITYLPHQGNVVTETSPNQIRDIVYLRGVLEQVAVELAGRNLGPRQMRELERLHTRLAAAVAANQGNVIARVNSEWHWSIYEASGSAYLIGFIRKLWDAFPWRTMWALPERPLTSLHEHSEIMQALRDGDPARAGVLMRVHITGGLESMGVAAEPTPDRDGLDGSQAGTAGSERAARHVQAQGRPDRAGSAKAR